MASILDRFTASLCDHVRGATDSAAIIHDLERSNLFVVPLDEEREWFRFHHLFAAVARSELELAHPDHVRSLHARAAEWFVSHGHTDEAIQHLLAADRTEEAALLVQANWLTYVDAGRGATVLGWLDVAGIARCVHAAPRRASRRRGWRRWWATRRSWPTSSRRWPTSATTARSPTALAPSSPPSP